MATNRSFANMLNEHKPYPMMKEGQAPKKPKKGTWDKVRESSKDKESKALDKYLK